MTIHTLPIFKDAIEAASQTLRLRPVFIEKDYWVTQILQNLSRSEFVEKVVFKGGTSLSKAYNCIKRFSEDVDLAVIPQTGISQDMLKILLKQIETTITAGLTPAVDKNNNKRFGRNRTTYFDYPKVFDKNAIGPIKEQVVVELNAFTNPVPHQRVIIESYLSQFFRTTNRTDLISQCDMDSFSINVLMLERTFFEKLLSINRLSYEGKDRLKEKIRHFYDLHELYHKTPLNVAIFTPASYEVLSLVLKDDRNISTFNGPWKERALVESPLFTELENTWTMLIPSYQAELSELIWKGKLPEPQSVLEVLQLAKQFLKDFSE